ncbi:MAG: carbamoyl-phosphate synthase domain-containing protein, partial [Oscillospiraceae bacterium]
SVMSLSELLEEREITGVYGVDTREMTHYIRKHGSCRALITSEDMSPEEARALLAKSETQSDEVARASCDRRWYSRTASHSNTIAVLDCGVKQSLINALGSFGCNVTVMPHDTSAAEILACAPDGLVISNGPGDPKKAVSALETVKALKGKLPMFGTGLGLLLIALACGADTAKLPFGMHGGCPARDAVSGRIFSASCALSYAPVASTLTSAGLVQTYSSIPGGLVFGVQSESQRLYGVLFDSEGAPGSRDACALLCSFVNSLQGRA